MAKQVLSQVMISWSFKYPDIQSLSLHEKSVCPRSCEIKKSPAHSHGSGKEFQHGHVKHRAGFRKQESCGDPWNSPKNGEQKQTFGTGIMGYAGGIPVPPNPHLSKLPGNKKVIFWGEPFYDIAQKLKKLGFG